MRADIRMFVKATAKLCADILRKKTSVVLIAGGGMWAESIVAQNIEKHCPGTSGYSFHRWLSRVSPPFCAGVVHFINRSVLGGHRPRPLMFYRASVLTWFHGDPADTHSEFGALGHSLRKQLPKLKFVTTSCSLTAGKLLRWGLPPKKLKTVPLGVDQEIFRPPDPEERISAKQRFDVPIDRLCIASFQKDGVGWESGMKPKLIKGPDLFLKVIEQLRTSYPLFVLLSGPARGYVKKGLEQLGVPYHHSVADRHADLLPYYHAADIYIIASREEGGPLTLLESMATGVPVVSTKAGMAPDVLRHGENGFLAEIEDSDTLADLIARLGESPDLRERFTKEGIKTANEYTWSNTMKTLIDEVYSQCF